MAVQAAPLINWGGDAPQSVAELMGDVTPFPIPNSGTWVPAPSAVTGLSGGESADRGAGYPITG